MNDAVKEAVAINACELINWEVLQLRLPGAVEELARVAMHLAKSAC